MKISALGEFFSLWMRVCSSPAAGSGRTSTPVMPGYALRKASMNALLVDSLRAEYTTSEPLTLVFGAAAAAGAAVPPAAVVAPAGAVPAAAGALVEAGGRVVAAWAVPPDPPVPAVGALLLTAPVFWVGVVVVPLLDGPQADSTIPNARMAASGVKRRQEVSMPSPFPCDPDYAPTRPCCSTKSKAGVGP